MPSKRRSVLYLLAGAVVVALRGADEAARLLAKGTDEAIELAGKRGDDAARSGDDAGSLSDEIARTSERAVRQHSLTSLYEDETATDSFPLPAGYYGGYEITPGHRTQLTFEYTESSNELIDVYLFDEQAFSEYTSAGQIPTEDQPLLNYSSAKTHSETLSPTATHYLIFDNTNAGFTPAKDNIHINAEASLAIID